MSSAGKSICTTVCMQTNPFFSFQNKKEHKSEDFIHAVHSWLDTSQCKVRKYVGSWWFWRVISLTRENIFIPNQKWISIRSLYCHICVICPCCLLHRSVTASDPSVVPPYRLPPGQYSKLFFITNLRELPPQSDPLWLTNLQQLLQSFPRLPSLPPLPFLLSVDGKSTTSSRQTPRWAASDCLQACQELSVGTAGADPGGRWRHGFYISRPVLWLAAVRVLKLHPKATSSLLRDVRMSTTHVKKNPSNWTYTCPRRSRRPCRPLTCNHTCRSRRTHTFTHTHTLHILLLCCTCTRNVPRRFSSAV